MTVPALVVRPEPGASATLANLQAAGVPALAVPLFVVEPLAWQPPDARAHDALLLTSANAVRHGGPNLHEVHGMSCWCVGETTAAAAMAAGFHVTHVGDSDAATLMRHPDAAGRRWLWLAGARHQPLVAPPDGSLTIVPVYALTDCDSGDALRQALGTPAIILAHSAAAARRLQTLITDRAPHHLVAISAAVAAAAGPGWRSVTAAAMPDDCEMVAIAATLCQKREP